MMWNFEYSTLLQNCPVYNAVILVGRKGNVNVERRSVGKIIADSRRQLSIQDLLTIFELLMSDYYVMKTETEKKHWWRPWKLKE